MGPIHGHLDRSQEKDEGQIADDILDWLGTVDAAGFSDEDADRLEQMLAQLKAADPAQDTLDTQESLKQFRLEYAPLFERTETVPAPQAADAAGEGMGLGAEDSARDHRHPRLLRFPAKTAGIIAAVLICGSVFAQACGVDIWGTIARLTSETFRFEKIETPYAEVTVYPIAEGETAYYDSLQAAEEAFGITDPLAPAWVPERFGEPEVYAEYKASGVYIYADYAEGEDFLTIRFNESARAAQRTVEKDSTPDSSYIRGGVTHHIVADGDFVKITWSNGTFECRITGSIIEEEAREIVDSIYKERD